MSTLPKRAVERTKQPAHSSTRKKSCLKCAEAKARCSLQRPVCARCQQRNLGCHYFTQDSPSSVSSGSSPASANTPSANDSSSGIPEDLRGVVTTLDCPPTLESIQIGSRWLDALIPVPGKVAKKFTLPLIQYISRVLKGYPKSLCRDELPPIVHPFQSTAPQLALTNCQTLLRMWENKAPGSESLVRETVWREMNRLFEEHHSYDPVALLSACQAYLLYAVHFFFSAEADASRMIDTTIMINLQELASAISLTGLCEPTLPSPGWESWIIAEAKRRTLYSMYTFDHVYNYSHNITSYIGTELGPLPAPSSKTLWTASTKDAWEKEYERYIAEWSSDIPRLKDLWPHQIEAVATERRERADRWVESVDEFGMFMFTITIMSLGS
ncbi:hypothetical protein C8R47DRAFT_1133362 [Mycena vitilis]|nr:hypothetical protein C8R47DRAFT_1133362 [Mycena vitilis]